MPNFGISFSPFSDDNSGKQNPRGPQVSPQEAIRVLSLRVPRTVGAGSPIPGQLLNGAGGAAFGGAQTPSGPTPGTPNMGLEELLAMLFGQRRSMSQGLSLPIDQSPGGNSAGGTFPPMIPGAGDYPAPPPQPTPAPPPKFTPVQPPAAPDPMPWDQPSALPAATSRGGLDISERRRV